MPTALQEHLVSTGVITPATGTLKSDVQSEFQTALGTDLLLDDASPQGRLIDNETTARLNVLQISADLANQINPDISTGTFLAALGALHGIKPVAATFATVPNTVLYGTFGTPIPPGSRVADKNGNKFATTTALAIGADGSVTTTVKALTAGKIDVAAGDLDTILDGQLGWSSVTNTTSNNGYAGTTQQTDAEFKAARNKLLSALGKSTPAAVMANVGVLPGVSAVAVRENPLTTTATIDGVVLPPHSTWVCVDGGVAADIAKALVKSKGQGSPWTAGTGNGTPVNSSVVEEFSGQTYAVTHVTPTHIPCSARVTVSQGTSAAALQTAVPDAILKYASSNVDGLLPLTQGVDVSPFELASAVAIEIPGVFVSKVEVSFTTPLSWSTNSLPIELWQRATFDSGNISVIVS